MVHIPSEQEFGDYADWSGRAALDSDGSEAGRIEEIFLDTETRRPEWVLVRLGGDAGHRLVPLAGAHVAGDTLRLAHATELIRSAAPVSTGGPIPQEQEQELYAHYGLDYSHEGSGTGLPSDPTVDEAATGTVAPADPVPDATTPVPAADAPPIDTAPAAAVVAGGDDDESRGPRLVRVEQPADAAPESGDLDREQAREDLAEAPATPIAPQADPAVDFAFPAATDAPSGSSKPDPKLIGGGILALALAILVLLRRRRS